MGYRAVSIPGRLREAQVEGPFGRGRLRGGRLGVGRADGEPVEHRPRHQAPDVPAE